MGADPDVTCIGWECSIMANYVRCCRKRPPATRTADRSRPDHRRGSSPQPATTEPDAGPSEARYLNPPPIQPERRLTQTGQLVTTRALSPDLSTAVGKCQPRRRTLTRTGGGPPNQVLRAVAGAAPGAASMAWTIFTFFSARHIEAPNLRLTRRISPGGRRRVGRGQAPQSACRGWRMMTARRR